MVRLLITLLMRLLYLSRSLLTSLYHYLNLSVHVVVFDLLKLAKIDATDGNGCHGNILVFCYPSLHGVIHLFFALYFPYFIELVCVGIALSMLLLFYGFLQ
jgi:hypothetical protein